MASGKGSSPRKRNDTVVTKKTPSRRKNFFFYLEGELHQHIHIDLGQDIITAWNFKQEKRVAYPWSVTKRRMKPSYRTGEVAKLINRSRVTIEHAILRGDIKQPVRPHSLDNERKRGRYAWQESDIMEARDFFATQHQGFPRKDGLITARPIPTRAELRAMMEHGMVTYMRTSEGEFIPTFKEIVW
jgi:hypothetical protein